MRKNYQSTHIILFNKNEKALRSEIISIGIPILMPDGKSLLHGNEMKIPPFREARTKLQSQKRK